MFYMKKYVDILISWGFTMQAIEMSKIISKAEELMIYY